MAAFEVSPFYDKTILIEAMSGFTSSADDPLTEIVFHPQSNLHDELDGLLPYISGNVGRVILGRPRSKSLVRLT